MGAFLVRCPCCGKLSYPRNFGIVAEDDEVRFEPEAMPEHVLQCARPARGLGRGRGVLWERAELSREALDALRASLLVAYQRVTKVLEDE
jgi:hypothetical protein